MKLAVVSEQFVHASEVLAGRAAPVASPTSDVSLSTITGPPVVALVTRGLQMPFWPEPGWMKPPCVGPKGERIGAIPLRGACWRVTINPTYLDADGKPQEKKPCPEPSYDPPPEEPHREYCLDPVRLEPPAPSPSPSPFPQALAPANGARTVGPAKSSSSGR